MSIAEKLIQIAENEQSIANVITTEADLIANIQSMVDNLPDASDGGYDEGYNEGHVNGYNEGYGEGHANGYHEGHEEGYSDGYHYGYYDGYPAGRDEGITEGIEQGKQEEYDRLVDETKIVEKTVSGSAIRVYDVSEIPHKCTVTADKDTNVTVCGKNLLNLSGRVVATPNGGENTTKRTFTGNQIFVGLTANNYWYSWYVASYRVDATSVTVTNTTGGYGIGFDLEIIPGSTYAFSYAEPYEIRSAFYQADGTYISYNIATYGKNTFRAPDNAKWMVVFCVPQNSNTEYTYTNLQVELGATVTNYVPYQERGKHSISAGQLLEVDSICPTMTVLADNDATITFGYHKSYGTQVEYDMFWDSYQHYGQRTSYAQAFSYGGWNDETFKPKYDIILAQGYTGTRMFYYSNITNIAETLEKRGLRLDTTLNGHWESMFAFTKSVRIPEINGTHSMEYGKAGLAYVFSGCEAKTIDKLIVAEDVIYTSTFANCNNLENIIFEGVIGKNIALAQSSKLTNASVQSIIDCLKDLTGATAQTLTLHATVKANLTEEQLATITGKNWSVA